MIYTFEGFVEQFSGVEGFDKLENYEWELLLFYGYLPGKPGFEPVDKLTLSLLILESEGR